MLTSSSINCELLAKSAKELCGDRMKMTDYSSFTLIMTHPVQSMSERMYDVRDDRL